MKKLLAMVTLSKGVKMRLVNRCVSLVLCLCLAFCGCMQQSAENSNNTRESTGLTSKIKYSYTYTDGFWTTPTIPFQYEIVRSEAELTALLYCDERALSERYLAVFDHYNDNFFESHTLILVCFKDSWPGARFDVVCTQLEPAGNVHIEIRHGSGMFGQMHYGYTVMVELETLLPEHTDVVIELHT